MPNTSTTLRYAALDLKRLRRDIPTLFFSVGLPVVFYILFGAMQDYGDVEFNGGNVAALVMIGMALYAGATGAVGAAGAIVAQHRTGWGRQLALTPLRPSQLAWAGFLNIAVRALLPVTAVFVTGALTKASMQPEQWLKSFLLTLACAIPFGIYGMACTMLIPSENTVSIASSSIVILAFAGNVFMPLKESILSIGRFSPMYGAQALARWPLSDGAQMVDGEHLFIDDPLWYACVNIAVWTVVFAGICLLLRQRDKGRA
ncbi:ABC transporter permease [Corynebacterium sp.]|uniref:ABC transporter permease n=1 Tax=unclassified Corynebacterium TaxID=2624378 RepID=UPI0027B9C9B2|nr:ABC transporter permease [Corynebacterium sp.]